MRRFREKDTEFFSAIAANYISDPGNNLEYFGYLHEYDIAGLMAKPVVEKLEIVYIYHYQGQIMSIPHGAVNLLGEACHKIGSPVQLGESISHCQVV